MTADDFMPHAGALCGVDAGGEGHEILLETVVPIDGSPRLGGAFALYFRGPANPHLAQGTYSMRIGGRAHLIFLVPLGTDAEGMRYEAIFN